MAKGGRWFDTKRSKVREMRTADTILGVIKERGSQGLPVEDIYRQLFKPALYLQAYGKIYRNDGAMTRGVTAETVDGMSQKKIEDIIERLRFERYQWTPVRRVYIEKKNSLKKRPLGLPTWSDKLLQEVIRSILEAYYEPQFRPSSHGFRPSRGCHTALRHIQRNWKGTVWFIEGDISKCFDSLDHKILLRIIGESFHDNRFLRLIENLLKAGYLEDWKYNATYSGTPQGGIVSPILSNLYLDRLDRFVEDTLLPEYNRGTRTENKEYLCVRSLQNVAKQQGRHAEAKRLRKQLFTLPYYQLADPDYRRLRYIRYADDFLLGFTGPREEAEDIKQRLGQFLKDELNLELSEQKTLITNAHNEVARFLDYDINALSNNALRRKDGRRMNGIVGLKVPPDVVQARCTALMIGDSPRARLELLNESEFTIVAQIQAEFLGFANYYQLAYNRSTRLNRLRWITEKGLVKTLANKLRISVHEVYNRYLTITQTKNGPRKVLEVKVERDGKKPLIARWGGLSLARQKTEELIDQIPPKRVGTVELLKRLMADTCELCGSQETVEVHHVRHLKDIWKKRKGQNPPPSWVVMMSYRQRKTLVVCRKCHMAIHQGKPTANEPLESRMS